MRKATAVIRIGCRMFTATTRTATSPIAMMTGITITSTRTDPAITTGITIGIGTITGIGIAIGIGITTGIGIATATGGALTTATLAGT